MQSRYWRLTFVAFVAIVLSCAMAVFLDYFKFRKAVEDLTRARGNATAGEIERSVRESLAVGLQFRSLDGMPELVARQRESEPLIAFIDVTDTQGRIWYSSDVSRVGQQLPGKWVPRAARAQPGQWHEKFEGEIITGGLLRNQFDEPVGLVAIRHHDSHLVKSSQAFLHKLLPNAASLAGAACVVAGLLVLLLARLRIQPGRMAALCVTGVPLLVMLGLLSLITLKQFDRELSPALAQWGATFVRSEAGLVGEAARVGVAVEDLYGVEQRLREQMNAHPEIGYLALLDARGAVLARVGERPQGALIESSVMTAEGEYARVALAIAPDFAGYLMKQLALDLGVLLVVALFLAIELLRALEVRDRVSADSSFAVIRAPAFVFFFAEELTRPVIPGFVNELVPGKWFSVEFLASVPIVLFMLIVALSQPLLGAWVARHDRRRLMLLGAVLAAIGFAACAFSNALWQLMLARSVGALGYAITFVASQAFVVDNTQSANRAEGFALLVSAIMVATVCGPPLGGMLADNLGFYAPFVAAAVLSLLAVALAARLPSTAQGARVAGGASALKVLSVLGNKSFSMLCVCAAVPSKMLLTGLAFYLLPLYAVALGGNQATAGRMLLLYAIVMVVLVPVAARWSDRSGRRDWFTAGGLAISTLGAVAVGLAPGLPSLALAMLILGLGQAISIASQSALVGVFAQDEARTFGETAVYGAYRLIERLGNAAGPLVAGVLLAQFGFQGAFVGLSAGAFGLAVVFFVFAQRQSARRALVGVAA